MFSTSTSKRIRLSSPSFTRLASPNPSSATLTKRAAPAVSFFSSSSLSFKPPFSTAPTNFHQRPSGTINQHRRVHLRQLPSPSYRISPTQTRSFSLFGYGGSSSNPTTTADNNNLGTQTETTTTTNGSEAFSSAPSSFGDEAASTSSTSSSIDTTPFASEDFASNISDGIAFTSASVSSSPQLSSALSDLAVLGLFEQHNFLVHTFQSLLCSLHDYSHLSWGLTIPAFAVLIRVLYFPLTIWSMKQGIKLNKIKPKMNLLLEEMKLAKAEGDNFKQMELLQRLKGLYKSEGTSPFRPFRAILVQGPTALCSFFAIRGMAYAGLEGMKLPQELGPWTWLTDLTVPDPLWALPILSTATMLLVLRTNSSEFSTPGQQDDPRQAQLKNFFSVVMVGSTYFIAQFPAALLLFWTATNLWSLFQFLLLKIPLIRSLCSIPPPPAPLKPTDPGYAAPMGFRETLRQFQTNAVDNARVRQEADMKKEALLSGGKKGVSKMGRGVERIDEGWKEGMDGGPTSVGGSRSEKRRGMKTWALVPAQNGEKDLGIESFSGRESSRRELSNSEVRVGVEGIWEVRRRR